MSLNPPSLNLMSISPKMGVASLIVACAVALIFYETFGSPTGMVLVTTRVIQMHDLAPLGIDVRLSESTGRRAVHVTIDEARAPKGFQYLSCEVTNQNLTLKECLNLVAAGKRPVIVRTMRSQNLDSTFAIENDEVPRTLILVECLRTRFFGFGGGKRLEFLIPLESSGNQ